MGRSFGFSSAWDRNARHVERKEKLDLMAAQIAQEFGYDEQQAADLLWQGDPLVKELMEYRDDEGRTFMQRHAYDYPGGFDPTIGDLHAGGNRICGLTREFDAKNGEVRFRFEVEREDGQLGGTHEVVIKQTGRGQWVNAGHRRIYE
jgi:hypothetical protein